MLADALHPLGVHPRNLPAPQDHPYVLRRLRETLKKTQRDAYACGTSPKAQPRTHTSPHHPTNVSAPTQAARTAPQEPCAPHSTTRLTPQPAMPPPNPVTQPANAAGRHAKPRPENIKLAGSRMTPTRTPTGTLRPTAPNPSVQLSKPTNPAKASTRIKPEPQPCLCTSGRRSRTPGARPPPKHRRHTPENTKLLHRCTSCPCLCLQCVRAPFSI